MIKEFFYWRGELWLSLTSPHSIACLTTFSMIDFCASSRMTGGGPFHLTPCPAVVERHGIGEVEIRLEQVLDLFVCGAGMLDTMNGIDEETVEFEKCSPWVETAS
jgi:hypothetical protein